MDDNIAKDLQEIILKDLKWIELPLVLLEMGIIRPWSE
jgi:hypothetical protein